jgi:chromosomal replication initiation ATPase DnaA
MNGFDRRGMSKEYDPALDSLCSWEEAVSVLREIEQIKASVCMQFGLSASDMTSGNKEPYIARARQVAMSLCRERTCLSPTAIGRHFGGRNRTTVRRSIRRIEELCAAYPAFAEVVGSCRERLNIGGSGEDTLR